MDLDAKHMYPNERYNNLSYLLITNIPKIFHSKDLRNYFSFYINKEAFHMFHYRHRPEESLMQYLKDTKQSVKEETGEELSLIDTKSKYLPESMKTLLEVIENAQKKLESKNFNYEIIEDSKSRCCSLILIKYEYLQSFKNLYNKKFWVNIDGNILPIRCLIFDLTSILKLNQDLHKSHLTGQDGELLYQTRANLNSRKRLLDFKKIDQLLEFDAPLYMPQGNVGTSISHFKSLLNQCKLPASIISKLGLDFMKSKCQKKYCQVHLNYGTEIQAGGVHPDFKEAIFTENGDLIPGYFDIKFNKTLKKTPKLSRPVLELEREQEDGAELEEWERFEAFHTDVTKQEREKERVFESELEIVWEKGGSGLVFYTDAQFWRVFEGGEEERELDEWDVDVLPYYQGGKGGDMDARDSLSMTEMDRLKGGTISSSAFASSNEVHRGDGKGVKHPHLSAIAGSSFSKKIKRPREMRETRKQRQERKKLLKQSGMSDEDIRRTLREGGGSIGHFEAHTRGIGRRLMEAQGWKDGEGLGREKKGMSQALASSWKHPLDKTGFGYSEKKVVAMDKEVCAISTAFDSPSYVDPMPSLYRSAQSSSLSHRYPGVLKWRKRLE